MLYSKQFIEIDNNVCFKLDDWQKENISYVIGQCIMDNSFFYVQVNDNEQWKGIHDFEYDHKPSRDEVEGDYINHISAIYTDIHEAEYGADGSRNFPNLNEDADITLHIKYQEPKEFNGFKAETDTITFGCREELDKYVNGEIAYDTLDNSVRKKDNEILLYADDKNGSIIWKAEEPTMAEQTISNLDEDAQLKPYTVTITEVLQREVSVDANSPDEAREMVEKMYYNCEVVLDAEDLKDISYDVSDDFPVVKRGKLR